MKKFDVVALGELLIDFTPAGLSATGMRLFEQNPGGAPANMLTAVSRAGLKTAFIGKIGADMHGDFLRSVLESVPIDTGSLITDPSVFSICKLIYNRRERFFICKKTGSGYKTLYRRDK